MSENTRSFIASRWSSGIGEESAATMTQRHALICHSAIAASS
jgi:hypothetical protein